MKSPRSPFLEAPREIRDLIYEFYVATDDGLGFVYNFETGKVRPRSGLPIDLSLMYTCRTVATEMQGVALGQNTITFTTFYSEELSSRVAEYDSFYQEVCQLQVGSLACAETSVIATNARDEVTRDFSWFGAAYDAAMRIQPTQDIYHRDPYDIARYRAKLLLVKTGGPAPLLHFQAVLRALTLASATGQQFVDEVGNKPFRMERDALCPLDLARLGHLKPWAIPTRARLSALKKAWPKRWWFFDEPEKKQRLSAAAIAIHFLETLPTTTASQLRRIVLDEDLPSSPDPWSHASGLIRFCKANPLPCIERRASVWKTVLQDNDDQSPIRASLPGFQTSRWIAEAHSLVAQGMPNGSFSLLFDGDSAPAESAAFFQSVLHRDTAWQEAFAALRGLGIGGWRQLLWHTHFDGMPQIMRDISSGKSNIRCNFDPGKPKDFQRIVDRHRQSSRRDIKIDHACRQPRFIEQLAPPDFHKIGHECWWTTPPEMDDAQIRRMAENDLSKGCYCGHASQDP